MPTIKPTTSKAAVKAKVKPMTKIKAKRTTKAPPTKAKIAAVVAETAVEPVAVIPVPGAIVHPGGADAIPTTPFVPSPPLGQVEYVRPTDSHRVSWLIDIAVAATVVTLVAFGIQQSRTKPVPPPTSARAVTTAAAVAPLRIGTLQPINVNSAAIATDPGNADVVARVYEGLVRVADDGTITPGLAVAYTQPSRLSWDVTLAEGLTFHSGQAVTAVAVKAALDSLRSTAAAQPYSSTIANITIVSPTILRFRLTKADPQFLNKLAKLPIFDPGATSGLSGTGPYMVKIGTNPTSDKLQLTPFVVYKGTARVGALDLLFQRYPTVEAMQNDASKGQLDVIDGENRQIVSQRATQPGLY